MNEKSGKPLDINKIANEAPIKISCELDGREWHGSYFSKSAAKDMLSRLKQNPKVKNIIVIGMDDTHADND